MPVSDLILLCLITASVVSFYYYLKERKGLRDFIGTSRRHTYHKNIDHTFQKKARRYLILSAAFFLVSMPFLIQKLASFINQQ